MSEFEKKQDKPQICKYCKHFDYYDEVSVCYRGLINRILGPAHVSPESTCKHFKYGKKQIKNERFTCGMWFVDVIKSKYNDFGNCPCISCKERACRKCDKFDMTNPICTKCLSCEVKTR